MITTKNISEELNLVSHAGMPSSTPMPILENYLFDMQEKEVAISCTDLSRSNTLRFTPKEIEGVAAKFCVGKILSELMSLLPKDETYTLEHEPTRQKLTIQGKNKKYIISTLDSAEFPELQKGEGETEWSLEIGIKDLLDLLSVVWATEAKDNIRPQFSSVNLEFNGKGIAATATNGFIVAYKVKQLTAEPISGNSQLEAASQVLLGVEDVKKLLWYFSNANGTASVIKKNGFLSVTVGTREYNCRSIKAKYYDVFNFVDYNSGSTVEIKDVEQFKKALKVAKTLYGALKSPLNKIEIAFTQTAVTIKTLNTEGTDPDNIEVSIPINYSGSPIKINTLLSHFTKVIQSIEAEEIRFKITTESKPLLFQPFTNGFDGFIICQVTTI